MHESLPKEKITALIAKVKEATQKGVFSLSSVLEIFPDVPQSVVSALKDRNTLTAHYGQLFNWGILQRIDFELDGAKCQIEVPMELRCLCLMKDNGFKLDFLEGKRLRFGKLIKVLFTRTWVWCELLSVNVSNTEVFIDMSLNAADKRIPVE